MPLNDVQKRIAKTAYDDDIQVELSNIRAPFRGAFIPKSVTRSKTYYDTITPGTKLQEYVDGYQGFTAGTLSVGRRQISWKRYFDVLRMNAQEMLESKDLRSEFAQDFAIKSNGSRRAAFYAAFEASVNGDPSQTTNTGPYTFNTNTVDNATPGQVIDSATYGAGWNYTKFERVIQAAIDKNWLQGDPIFWLIDGIDYRQMLETPQFVDKAKYTNMPRVDEAVAMMFDFEFGGVNFRVVNDLPRDSTTSPTKRYNYVWTRSSMLGAVVPGKNMDTLVSNVGDTTIDNDTAQYKINDWFGFDRKRDNGVIRVENSLTGV